MTTIKEIKVHGRDRWQVDAGVMEGRRRRQIFTTETAAKKFAATVDRDKRHLGDRWLHLPPSRRDEIMRTLEEATEKGVTIEQLWEFWKSNSKKPVGKKVSDAYDQFIVAKSNSGLSEKYMEMLQYDVGNFAKVYGSRDVGTITGGLIEEWFEELKLKPATRASQLAKIGVFFSWCKRQEYIPSNPCDKIQRVRVVTPDPEILTNDQCRALVAAAKRSDLGLLTYLGLALFCGIRPHEARRLTSKDIDMKQGIVALSAEKAKVRNRRIIDLTEPAKRCIRAGRKMPQGMDFRRRFDKLRKEAGIKYWPHDALRKTCASHFYNLYGSHKAVEQLGHSVEIMLRNYRQLVSKEDTKEWLEI